MTGQVKPEQKVAAHRGAAGVEPVIDLVYEESFVEGHGHVIDFADPRVEATAVLHSFLLPIRGPVVPGSAYYAEALIDESVIATSGPATAGPTTVVGHVGEVVLTFPFTPPMRVRGQTIAFRYFRMEGPHRITLTPRGPEPSCRAIQK